MAMRMRLAQFALAAVGICIASGADAATFGAGRAAGVDGPMIGHTGGVAMTRTALLPSGFSHGNKVGFAGRHVPRGWSEGRKVGWHHGSRPPGLRR
jgi:hypothetical protein